MKSCLSCLMKYWLAKDLFSVVVSTNFIQMGFSSSSPLNAALSGKVKIGHRELQIYGRFIQVFSMEDKSLLPIGFIRLHFFIIK